MKKRSPLHRDTLTSGRPLSDSTIQRFNDSTRPKIFRHWSLAIRFAVILVLVLEFACVGRRLTKANVDEVGEGMSKKQVESILGPPTNIDSKDFLILKKTTYVYRQGNDTVTIVFKDDKVAEKQSTLTD